MYKNLFSNMRMPVIASPMFIVSNPNMVIEQCKSGIIGSFPALNARTSTKKSDLDNWLHKIKNSLNNKTENYPPFAINQIVHHTNKRLYDDLDVIVKHKVPIVITSLGAKKEINDAIHSYNGFVFHDVTTNSFAKKAIEKGADGLIAIATGAGGHAGFQSPFALIQEIREWYNGPLALGGAISNGRSINAALKLGADFAYIGSPFIATTEANASNEYKNMIIESNAEDIVNTDYFTNIPGNYLKKSIINANIDLKNLEKKSTNQNLLDSTNKKTWVNIWGCGQGISNVKNIIKTKTLVNNLYNEYKYHIFP